MLRFCRPVAALILLVLTCESLPGKGGFYSKSAVPLRDAIAGSDHSVLIDSPNHRSRVIATYREDKLDTHIDLRLTGELGDLQLDLNPGVASELLWSPDSRAFFVTSSDGGANGNYHLYLVDQFGGKLQNREITNLIYKQFGHPFRCDPANRWFERPNVAGIGWTGRSHQLWIAAEVVPHSVCDSFGTFRVFEFDPETNQVLRILGQLEAKRELRPMLGEELQNADDSCARRPKSCFVSTNHPEIHSK